MSTVTCSKIDGKNQGSVLENKETEDKETAKNQENNKARILTTISNKIIFCLESGFARLGFLIATHPWKTIIICCTIVAFASLGFLRFKQMTDLTELWVPYGAKVRDYKYWVAEKFPSAYRFVSMIFVADNALLPSAVQAMNTVYKNSALLTTSSGQNFSTLCAKLGSTCLVRSILELWSYNDTTIQSLTANDILTQINTVTTSPVYYNAFDVTSQVGGASYSGSNIISASAATMTWFLNASYTSECAEWESLAINLAFAGQTGVSVYVYTTRSFSDVADGVANGDMVLVIAGYSVMIVFMSIILGRFNCIEHRIGLAFCGLLVVGMSVCFSLSLSSAAGWEYGPVHTILPLLLLGIGVDDMFVIVSALGSLSEKDKQQSLQHRISIMLKHAGVSITVTSFTDIVAFGIGATTILPALKSFCIFACVGIAALYCLSATFLVACITFDEKRKYNRQNACLCCYTHKKDYKISDCSKKERIPMFLKNIYAPWLLKTPVKIIVVIVTAVLFCVNIWGFINLEQKVDFSWFLPTDSYPYKYIKIKDQYFPSSDVTSAVYCGNIDYFNAETKLNQLSSSLKSNIYVSSGSVNSWFESFIDYLSTTSTVSITSQLDANKYPVNESSFVSILYDFITTIPSGMAHSSKLKFTTNNTVIDASFVSFTHVKLNDSKTEIQAMESIQSLVNGIFGEDCFAYVDMYRTWATNKVIQEELYRNLGVASASVFIVTLVLIANVWTSLMVFLSVAATLVDVGGSMHFWGLTIDTTTCILLILAIGLTVDYSAHIGHTFMTLSGTRNDRAKATLVEIGTPVFSGGFSTFLAFLFVAGSKTYLFTTCFRIFFLVVIFGLFHGLVCLPVILSWFGPSPYVTANERYNTQNKDNIISNQKTETNRRIIPISSHDENIMVSSLTIPKINASSNRTETGSSKWEITAVHS